MPNYEINNEQLTLQAKGIDILANTNTVQFNGLARIMTGNFDHAVYLTSQQNTHLFAKAGITVFERPIVNGVVDSTTRFATLVAVPNGQIMVLFRTGGDMQVTQVATVNKIVPLWFRFKRSGNDLIAFYSIKPLNTIGSYDWQLLTTINTFFSGWNQVYAGMMGLSHTETGTSTVVFKGLNFGVGLPYVIDFDIASITWSRAFQGLSAVLASTNPSNKSLEYSKNGTDWTGYGLFENLTEEDTYTFYVRDANKTDAFKTKTDTAPTSGGCSMAITTLQVVASTGGKYNITVSTSNPDSYVLEYKMDGEVWKNNGVYTDISAGSHTFSVRNRDKTTCIKTKTQNIGSTVVAGINEIAEIVVPAPEMLNQVDLRFLGDFEIPLHPNPLFTDQRIFECFQKGPLFRHQIATVGNIFNKGFTGVEMLACKPNIETQGAPYDPTFQSTIDIRKTLIVGGGASYVQLKMNVESSATDELSVDYSAYSAITNDYKFNLPQVFQGNASEKYKGRLVILDLENGHNNIAKISMQDYVNRTVALHAAILDGVGPQTLVGFMYQGLPMDNLGFGVERSMYSRGADDTWAMVCAMTPNATEKNFPQSLLGKSMANLDNRICHVFEYYLKYEAFVPEKTQLKNILGDNLKNTAGVDLPLFTHFGVPQIDQGKANYKPSVLHWAFHTAAALGLNKKLIPKERLFILQTNHFNEGYFYSDYSEDGYIHPSHSIIKQFPDGKSRYDIPNYIVAGIEAIAFFSGCMYYQFEANVTIGDPINRSEGEVYVMPPLTYRRDYHGLAASQAMAKRLTVGEATIGSQQFTMGNLIDGTEIYLLEKIKVNYLTRTGFNTVKVINPADWMEFELPPVMAIVNLNKKLIAIWATVAYPGSQEVKELDVCYDENGYNFCKRIVLQDYKNSLHIFSLDDTDPTSGGGSGGGTTAVAAPIITSIPSTPIAGSLVMFTTTATGAIEWYKNGVSQNVFGTSFSITNPLVNDVITAKRTVNGVTSSVSNHIAFIGQSSVTITQPNRVSNYYKSSNGSPQIILNYTYSTADVVYLSNSEIKIGFNLRYGGAICYLSQINSTLNLVNNGYDGGRQIQPDYYQNPSNYTQNGKNQIQAWQSNGYNTTLGGDYNKNTVTLLEYYQINDGYYLKLKPLLWSFDAELSEIVIEVKYTLHGNAVKCEYKYTNQRTDSQIPNAFNIKGWALPVAYLNQNFTQFHCYTGNTPFTNDSLSVFSIPSNIPPSGSSLNGEANSKEFWAAMVNPLTNVAIGFYNKMANRTDTYFQFKRENVFAGNTNTEFSDGFSLIQVLDSYVVPDSQNQWSRTDIAHIVVDDITQVRAKMYEIHQQI